MSQSVVNALLNFVLVSIPEEIFLVVMTLIFLKRFDLLDVRMWKQNLKWLSIPIIPMAFMLNFFRYIIIIPKPIVSLFGYILMTLLMIYVISNNNFERNKFILKIIIFTFLSFGILLISETVYVPAVLFLLKKSITFFNDNIIYNFLFSIPSRVLQYSLCGYILIKKNNTINFNLLNIITKNHFLSISFLSMIIFFNLFILYFTKLIGFDGILNNLRFIEQLLVIIMSLSLPIITIVWFLLIVNYTVTKQKQIQQAYENLIIKDDVTTDVED